MASLVITPSAGTTPFDPMRSFSHIALLGGPPLALVVHPSVTARELKDFIAQANAQPGGISYGSPGAGSALVARQAARCAPEEWPHR